MWARPRGEKDVESQCSRDVAGDTRRSLRLLSNRDTCLGHLVFAFPCVVCSFTFVLLLLCFCSCPLLLYRLKEEVRYNFFALLYFVLAFLVFGVVVECLLVAWRGGRLGCCCCCCRRSKDEPRRPEAIFSNAAFVDGYGSLAGVGGQLVGVHVQRKTTTPPPSPVLDVEGRNKGGSVSDDADIVSMCERLATAIGEQGVDVDRKKDVPPPLLRDTSFQGLPEMHSFGTYLHLVEVQTPLSPRETVFQRHDDP